MLTTKGILFKQRSSLFYLRRGLASASSARVAVVTGAARGIGRAIALRLASDGFDLAVSDLPSSESALQDVCSLISQYGRRAFVCPGDVSVEEDVKTIVGSTVASLGGIDVMVANAGICMAPKPLTDSTLEDWERIFSVNARGTFLCYKYAAEQMLKQGRGGRIIGASSISGKKGYPGFSVYGATKFAVRGLTQAAAQELAPHGITVNAYAPGLIETDMLDLIRIPSTVDVTDVNAPISAAGLNGNPEDVAGLVSYLSSSKSHFITGQSIAIDGGCVFD